MRLTEQQRQQRQEWVSHTTDIANNPAIKLTEFECELLRLGLTKENCHENSEMFAWIKAHKDSRYVPERLLARLHLRMIYDEADATFSLSEGTTLPTKQQEEVGDEPGQEQDAAA